MLKYCIRTPTLAVVPTHVDTNLLISELVLIHVESTDLPTAHVGFTTVSVWCSCSIMHHGPSDRSHSFSSQFGGAWSCSFFGAHFFQQPPGTLFELRLKRLAPKCRLHMFPCPCSCGWVHSISKHLFDHSGLRERDCAYTQTFIPRACEDRA